MHSVPQNVHEWILEILLELHVSYTASIIWGGGEQLDFKAGPLLLEGTRGGGSS